MNSTDNSMAGQGEQESATRDAFPGRTCPAFASMHDFRWNLCSALEADDEIWEYVVRKYDTMRGRYDDRWSVCVTPFCCLPRIIGYREIIVGLDWLLDQDELIPTITRIALTL